MIEKGEASRTANEFLKFEEQFADLLFKLVIDLSNKLDLLKKKQKDKTSELEEEQQGQLEEDEYLNDLPNFSEFDFEDDPLEYSIKLGDDVVYARTESGKQFTSDRTLKTLEELKNYQLSSRAIGNATIPSLEIKEKGNVVFSSDDDGKVQVNQYQQRQNLSKQTSVETNFSQVETDSTPVAPNNPTASTTVETNSTPVAPNNPTASTTVENQVTPVKEFKRLSVSSDSAGYKYTEDVSGYSTPEDVSIDKLKPLYNRPIDSQLRSELFQVGNAQVGEKVSARNFQLSIGNDTLLRTDAKGVVISNLLNKQVSHSQSQSDFLDLKAAPSKPTTSTTVETNSTAVETNSTVVPPNNSTTSTTVETGSEKVDEPNQVESASQNGIEAISNNFNEFENSAPTTDFLNQLLRQLLEVVNKPKEQDTPEFISTIEDKIGAEAESITDYTRQLEEKYRVVTHELWELRKQNKRRTDFFTGVVDSIEETKDNIASRINILKRDSRAAMTVKNLLEFEGKRSENTYIGEEYKVLKQGRYYSLTDKNNKVILKFKSMAAGAKILTNKLSETQYQDLEILRDGLKQPGQELGKFARFGVNESQNERRIKAIADRITVYAKKVGSPVEIKGQHYEWTATPTGQIEIKSAGEKEPIFVKKPGQLTNRMTAKDIAFFEEKLAKISTIRQVQPTPVTANTISLDKANNIPTTANVQQQNIQQQNVRQSQKNRQKSGFELD